MLLNPRRISRYYYLRFIRLQGSPYSLAMGSALGASIAITPTLPLHTICIIAITFLLRANTLAALLVGTVISNPFTFAAQYYISWKIGNFLLPGRLDLGQLDMLLQLIRKASFIDGLGIMAQMGFDTLLVLQIGGLALAAPLGVITYYFGMYLFSRLHQKRQQKHLLNRQPKKI